MTKRELIEALAPVLMGEEVDVAWLRLSTNAYDIKPIGGVRRIPQGNGRWCLVFDNLDFAAIRAGQQRRQQQQQQQPQEPRQEQQPHKQLIEAVADLLKALAATQP